MTPDQLRVEQNQIMRPSVAASLVILRELPVAPLSPAAWLRVIAALFPLVLAGRRASVDLSRRYYASQSPAGSAPDVPDTEYVPAMLSATLERFARSGLENPETAPRAAVSGAAAVGRHVDQAGREYVAKASSADDIRYARYDPFGETCAFCRLLISRGPVYLSEASGAFQSHPQCTCVAVPVWDEDDWPGRDQYLEAERLYVESTVGKSGKEAIKAFRAAVEG